MQMNLVMAGELRQLAPTTSATAPPIPASTSSNTMVATGFAVSENGLERQHDTREFAAGGDGRQRFQRLAHIRRNGEHGTVDALSETAHEFTVRQASD